ncbi:MAG: ubiquinol-cytochrome c reductase iron-sulfur subunit [Rhizobiales bacterium]|nr:ubiquinol-cytochrome c reductase iron-sulfur subunit [Hyphomicrobiales bacterium]
MEFVVATELVEPSRRDFLFIATGAVAAVGAASAVWPFVSQMNPDAATIAAGAPVELDLGAIAAGQSVKVKWRGKIIFVNHRTPKEIEEARAVPLNQLPDPATDESRAKKPEWLVVIGVCTHLGCIPLDHQGDYGGWFCPCHGSHYDTAGRIRKGPAPRNLDLPPYSFVSDTRLLIG